MKRKPVSGQFLKNNSESRKTWSRLILKEAKQFCLNTALHGYRFIVLPKRILLERVIWAILCLVSFISAVTLLCIAWFDFQKNPIISVTDSTHYPIWNYDFPAVTICNFNKISRKKVFQLAKNLSITNGRTVEQLALDIRLFFQLINTDDQETSLEDYTRVDKLLQDNNLQADDVLQMLAPTCEEMLLRCQWKGEEKRCEHIFEQIRTAEGFCCSFNYFALNHTFAGVMASKAPKRPRRVSACGYQTGLEIILQNRPGDYFATHIPSVGHRIFIGNPYYFPDNNIQSVMVNQKSTNIIAVNPKLTYATEPMARLSPLVRQCFFPMERRLSIFDSYNYHNCIVECKNNMTIKYCGCSLFYIRKKDSTQNICSLVDLPCMKKYRSLIQSSISSSPDTYYNWDKTECSCLPDCEIVGYVAEVSSGELIRTYSTNDLTLFGGLRIHNQSVVRVFFIDLVGTRTRWDVIFNWHTLLAYYGGILGLFMGFSFVSALEILYFFAIRLLADAAKNKNTSKQTRTKRHMRKSKITVLPVTYQYLDPSRLIIPRDVNIQQYKRNSYFFN